MTNSNSPDSESPQPFDWIHLELIPLPDKTEQYEKCVVWWNPGTGEILGDHANLIIGLVKDQLIKGSVKNSMGTIEFSDPFAKPSELASVLGQYFWVVPVPVADAYEEITPAPSESQNPSSNELH